MIYLLFIGAALTPFCLPVGVIALLSGIYLLWITE